MHGGSTNEDLLKSCDETSNSGGEVMPFEEAIEMLKKSIKKMYGKKGQVLVMLKRGQKTSSNRNNRKHRKSRRSCFKSVAVP